MVVCYTVLNFGIGFVYIDLLTFEMSDTHKFTAIVLSGDRPEDALAKISPGNRKALLNICARPMLLHVLETLSRGSAIADIHVTANAVSDISEVPEVRDWIVSHDGGGRIRFWEGADSPAASVLKVIKNNALAGPILVTTADNPLLTTSTLDTFCARAVQLSGADVLVALATERDIQARFPLARRTYIRLKGGGYSGCNLFALMSENGTKAADAWRQVEKRRKRPWQLISHFGFGTLLKAMFRQLDIDGAFASVSRSMGLNVEPVIVDDPVAAMDVDRPEHIEIAESVLSSRDGLERAQ